MHLGLPAFAHLLKRHPDARLTMVGEGVAKPRWQKLADELGIADAIDWVPWVDRSELPSIYASHDVLLYPSLYDSGAMVVLEALQYGLPVVCLKNGGPGTMVDDRCGRAVEIGRLSRSELEARLGGALIELAESAELRRAMAAAARSRCFDFRWETAVRHVYAGIGQS